MINKGIFKFDAWQDDIDFSWKVWKYSINTGKEILAALSELDIKPDKLYNQKRKYFIKHKNDLFINSYIKMKNNKEQNKSFKKYNPLKINDLFIKFAYIDFKNNKEILDFVNEFGLLEADGDKFAHGGVVLSYPLEKFKEKVKVAHELASIYELLLDNDIRELKKIIKQKDKKPTISELLLKDNPSELFKVLKHRKEKDFIDPWESVRKKFSEFPTKSEVIFLFLSYINNCLHDIFSQKRAIVPSFNKIEYDSTGKMESEINKCFKVHSGWVCEDLLTYIHLQFYFFIAENKKIGHCKYCSGRFIIDSSTRSDKTSHTKCRKKASYQRKKRAKKLLKEGMSVDEVYLKLNKESKKEAIKRWAKKIRD